MFSKRFVLCGLAIIAALSLIGCGGSSKSNNSTTGNLPVSVTVVASATTVDATNPVTLSVRVTNDKNAAGVNWTVGGGGTLSASSITGTTYTAPAASASALKVTVTATSITDPTKTGTATINVPVGPAISTASLVAGTVGTAYLATLAGGGGISPYSWSLTSTALPTGLSMNTAGVISGTPMATGLGVTNVAFMMTDSGKATALTTTVKLALTINAAPAITFSGAPLTAGTFNSAYTATVAAIGGAGTLTHTLVSGILPAGLGMTSGGAISGTPTVLGTFPITVKAADAFGDSATQVYSVKVTSNALTITSFLMPTGYVGTTYLPTTLAATGGSGTGYTWALASGSSLPGGLSISTSGALAGKPTARGITNFSVTVTDSATNTATAALTIAINEPLTIDSKKLPNGYIGIPYSQSLLAHDGSGTGYSWTLVAGSTLPNGWTLSAAGVLAGKPATAGTIPFTASVKDSLSNTVSAKFSITVSVGVAITSLPTLPNGFVGENYYTTLAAVGGSNTGYNWSVTSGSTLPAGLNMLIGGVLRGKPTTAGNYTFSITVTDSASNSASANFALGVGDGVTITTPATLPAGTVGANYSKALMATGGTGTGYSWSVDAAGASKLAALKLTLSNVGLISGKPAAVGTATFTVTVMDSFANRATATFTLDVSLPGTPTLPSANPISLPSATVDQLYSGSINALGGVGPYAWTVNSTPVPQDGSLVGLSNGLSVTNLGNQMLSVSGTPSTTGSVSIIAEITDSNSISAGPITYTVAVNTAGSQVSGHIALSDNCGGVTAPPISVSIDTTPMQTTSTDTNGDYSFANVPSGTYTITPSITGPSSVFFPNAISNLVVSNTSLDKQNFTVSLGYIVSGTVSYSGSQTGQVYVSLNSTSCGGKPLGTSISALGAFSIRGVPPGTYDLTARMNIQRNGNANASDPAGSGQSVAISNLDSPGATVMMIDPTAYTLVDGPELNSISPSDQGVVINYGAITKNASNGSKVELPTAYTVEWSTDSTFVSPPPASYSFKAGGANGSGVWFLNDLTSGMTGTFSTGTPYYFRACGKVASVTGPCTVYGGATPLAVTIGAPTGANTVTGAITFGDAATGPLYVGFFDQDTGKAYETRIASPVTPQTYTVQVPDGSNYFFFAILDQNNNGAIDSGDISNTHNDSSNSAAILSSMTKDLTLTASKSTASVTTQHFTQTNLNGTYEGYTLNLDVREGTKLPVSVALISGKSVVNPIDIGKCQDCGNNQFQYSVGTGGTAPTGGDQYGFEVTYSDGTSETATGSVTAVLNAFATNLAPSETSSTSTQPTFTWTDPASAANYTYQFNLSDNNGTQIWQIPGNNSKSNGFSSSITSIVWGTSPTADPSNIQTVLNLTTGTQYFWQIQVQDSDGNSAQTQVEYLP